MHRRYVSAIVVFGFMQIIHSFPTKTTARFALMSPVASYARGVVDEVTSRLAHASSTTGSNDVSGKLNPRDSLAETSKTGEFKRRDAVWRNWISAGT